MRWDFLEKCFKESQKSLRRITRKNQKLTESKFYRWAQLTVSLLRGLLRALLDCTPGFESHWDFTALTKLIVGVSP